jgi:hypothetical protein
MDRSQPRRVININLRFREHLAEYYQTKSVVCQHSNYQGQSYRDVVHLSGIFYQRVNVLVEYNPKDYIRHIVNYQRRN